MYALVKNVRVAFIATCLLFLYCLYYFINVLNR